MVALRSSTFPPRHRYTAAMACAVACAATAAILGGGMSSGGDDLWQWLHWFAKPLTTVLILGVALLAGTAVSLRYRRWIVAGMVCSLIGDVLLMLPANLFVAGLVAFLCGHGCFITAFLGDSRLAVRPLAWLASLLIGGLNLGLLWPSIPAALHPAVAVYGSVLSVMGGQAIGRAWFHSADALALPARRAAVGAALFMLSDSLLAWNRFHAPLPWSTLWVLGSYYAALWCIARSVARDEISIETGALT
jgi:uncharacterized membrane protein YhhN